MLLGAFGVNGRGFANPGLCVLEILHLLLQVVGRCPKRPAHVKPAVW